jgi:hypothetical protein
MDMQAEMGGGGGGQVKGKKQEVWTSSSKFPLRFPHDTSYITVPPVYKKVDHRSMAQ